MVLAEIFSFVYTVPKPISLDDTTNCVALWYRGGQGRQSARLGNSGAIRYDMVRFVPTCILYYILYNSELARFLSERIRL